MEMMEIILLIAGGLIFILSFLIPDKKGASRDMGPLAEKEVRELVGRELESLRSQVDEMVEESVADTMDKTERSLERLCNEKIMAVNEYSDTVLKEIHKNHEEAVFLYDMLNNKHTSLKNTTAEVNQTVKEAEETIRSLQQFIQEVSAIPVQESGETEEGFALEPEEALFTGTAVKNERASFPEQEPETWPGEGSQEISKNEKILRLYKKGKSATVIAKELGLGIGEVRLVIDLYRKQV